MAEEITISGLVSKLVDDISKDPTSRFSKSDFQGLVYAVLQDPCYHVEKFILKSDRIVKSEESVNADMRKFLDKLLKHAGMSDSNERTAVIDSFTFGVNDISWITDAVDEAMWLYTESGKNMRVFRDKLTQLSFKKFKRSGKYDGKISYKKTVTDREMNLAKKLGVEKILDGSSASKNTDE